MITDASHDQDYTPDYGLHFWGERSQRISADGRKKGYVRRYKKIILRMPPALTSWDCNVAEILPTVRNSGIDRDSPTIRPENFNIAVP